MTLRILPDLDEPAGGYAWIVIPSGQITGADAPVALFDSYRERWLGPTTGTVVPVGDPNWQNERHEFGPYPVARGQDGDRLRVGPEIVNQLEEYTQLEMTVGGVSAAVIWPDNVLPRAGAAVLGKLISADRPTPSAGQTNLVGKAPESSAPPPEEPPPPVVAEQAGPAENVAPKRRNLVPIIGLGALAATVAIAALIYVMSDRPSTTAAVVPPVEEPVAEVPPEPDPEPTVIADADTCSRETLMETAGGFDAVEAALSDCGADVSADTILFLIEEAALREDARALALFGALYDDAADEPLARDIAGLRLRDDPGVAARYYARAVAAGSPVAAERLRAVCDRLAARDDTLSRGAYDDHCG
jgi:hypothetical protein